MQSEFRRRIGSGADRQGDEDFVGMEPWIIAAEMLRFQLLNRFNNNRGDQVHLMIDSAELFQGVQ